MQPTLTPQQRIDQFISRCQQKASQYSLNPRPANEQLLVGLLHDGNELTCPTLTSWPVTGQQLNVGQCYPKRKIDNDGATNEHRLVTVLALIPTRSLSTELYVSMTIKTIFDTYHTITSMDGDRVEVESSGPAKTWKQQLTKQQFVQRFLLYVVHEGWEIIT